MREETLHHLIPPDLAAPAPHAHAEALVTPSSLVLHAFRREGDHVMEGVIVSPDGRWWWIAGGVPRLLGPEMYYNDELTQIYSDELRRLGLNVPRQSAARGRLGRIQSKTIDRFGTEWLRFRDWGYHPVQPNGDALEYQGGLWANTLAAFRSKTFLDDRLEGQLVLDAGCGNGRFTAAALASGAREVISVDIGWGVDATFDHHRNDPRVHVVQASLFDLPIKRVDSAFSIGVLMHTGDAARAFGRIASLVAPGGHFAVRLYHRGNWAYECVDGGIRAVTTRLSKPTQLRFARRMARFGSRLMAGESSPGRDVRKPSSRVRWYQLLRNWPTVHHNLDWWTAPAATHHTTAEVAAWGRAGGLEVVRTDPGEKPEHYKFWDWPEALTVLFERPRAIGSPRVSTIPYATPVLAETLR